MLHWQAWEKGVKSLYYCRSKSVQRAEKVGKEKGVESEMTTEQTDYEECLACQ